LGEPLGSQSDIDTVQSKSVEKGDDDSVSYAIYVPNAFVQAPFLAFQITIWVY
jgi:hypothetical protein